jgi:hypothetical protein
MLRWLLIFGMGALLFGFGLWRNRRFDRTKVAGNIFILSVGTLIMFTVAALIVIGLIISYLTQLWFPDGFE